MKRMLFTLLLLFVLSLGAPTAHAVLNPPPKLRRARVADWMQRIRDVIEARRIQREAAMERRLFMPGCMPVEVPPIPTPRENLTLPEIRMLRAEDIRPGLLIPQDQEEEEHQEEPQDD